MFALGIRYLNGWSMAAADGARKERAEWPPHPDRVFMALAAAWFETGQDAAEGRALRWLESLPPPALAASDATDRTAVVSYVPVNDTQREQKLPVGRDLDKLKKAGLTLIPGHRLRHPRGFPISIPRDPTVHLMWPEAKLGGYQAALEQLAAKVTHVGHSASFVQAWLEARPPRPTWIPATGAMPKRLRVTSPGRLESLEMRMNRAAWIAYHDRCGDIERAEAELRAMQPPPRVAWGGFPDAILLTDETQTKQHPNYSAAKAGDAKAATSLVRELVNEASITPLRQLLGATKSGLPLPTLVSAHAYERGGINAIPAALAELLRERTGILFKTDVVQTNVVSHTGAGGYGRLARQARFAGGIDKGHEYVMVDDFVGQGGTLANLRGWIEKRGGKVVGAVALTGKPYSAKLNPSQEQLHELRQRHGRTFEKWWREHFDHSFDCLTQSEARYLARSPDADTIRNRLAAEKPRGDRPSHARSPREQRQHIKGLKERLAERFPDGQPAARMRPVPGRWQGYGRPPEDSTPEVPGSVFDSRLLVLGISGKRVSLPATLKLTTALRGLLMKACPEQPPPEWFSGHRPDGTPTSEPHLASAPLPFVGAEHADGRIMGLALVLPAELDAQEAGGCLHPILHDRETGLPREHRLFGGQWFECRLQLETRERPPTNLDGRTWTRPSRVWATVTPVVLNRHFDGKNKWERAVESVKDMCEHIGLPRPREVLLHPVSRVEGVPTAREFPRLVRKRDGGRCSHNHAVIVFDEPVRGPVLVGAGRFRGYGWCRPMNERGDERP